MSKAVRKHRHLNHATCRQAGYNAPAAPKSRKGGGYPSRQSFRRPKGN